MQKDKILSELYNGDIRPFAEKMKKDTLSHNLYNELECLADELSNLLDEDGKKLLDSYCEGYGNLILLNSEERFKQGFKMGGRLAIEILYEDDETKV